MSDIKGAVPIGFSARNRTRERSLTVLLFPVSDKDSTGFHAGGSENDDPGRTEESKRLADYVERCLMLPLMLDLLL